MKITYFTIFRVKYFIKYFFLSKTLKMFSDQDLTVLFEYLVCCNSLEVF